MNQRSVRYTESLNGIEAENLRGFFVGWPNPPSPATLLNMLQGSSEFVLAVDGASRHVIGFVYAISDGVLSAYIPLLEVLPEWQGQGVGSELMRRILTRLEALYSIDLVCDIEMVDWYERFGMRPEMAMIIRNYANQSGRW